jgi:hypothetical protein
VKKWERCPSKTRTGEEKKGWTTLKNEGRNKEWRWCRTKRDADDVVFFCYVLFISVLFFLIFFKLWTFHLPFFKPVFFQLLLKDCYVISFVCLLE